MTTSTEPLTNDMIRELRDEAGCAGDSDTVDLCEDALDSPRNYSVQARAAFSLDHVRKCKREIASLISEARARVDTKPFTRVVFS